MNAVRRVTLCFLVGLVPLVIVGCGGKKADENKPMADVKAEAEKMDTAGLRAAATAYKDAMEAKKGEVEKLAAKLKEIPAAEILGEKAKTLQADIEKVQKSMSALKERFQVYYDKLKEKGGDVSGLSV